jgi:excinuclease ABC subunit B
MYADHITDSMRYAINETNRRRVMQMEYNKKHGITPKTILKEVYDRIEITRAAEGQSDYEAQQAMTEKERENLMKQLEKEMKTAAAALEFEKAASLRDQILKLKKEQEEMRDTYE